MDVEDLSRTIRRRRSELDSKAGAARALVARVQTVSAEVEHLTETTQILEKVALLLTSLGEERQNVAQSRIETLVTRGLQTIFDESLSFHLVASTRSSAAQVDFIVRSTLADGRTVDTPVMEARGGGLAATVGFLLRLVVMLLRNGVSRENIMLLDETFAMVSAEYVDRLGEFVREVVDKTGVQIIMVTHQTAFAEYADSVYRFRLEDGVTKVNRDG